MHGNKRGHHTEKLTHRKWRVASTYHPREKASWEQRLSTAKNKQIKLYTHTHTHTHTHIYIYIKDSVAVCRIHDENYVKGQLST